MKALRSLLERKGFERMPRFGKGVSSVYYNRYLKLFVKEYENGQLGIGGFGNEHVLFLEETAEEIRNAAKGRAQSRR